MLAHQVALPDTTLAVRTRGSGMPVVLLHAFPLDGRMWAAQEPLADQVRLIVPDMRGFGGSRGPGPASVEQLADDAVALLDALHVREPAVFCGCSMGGYVAQHVAARHADRVRAVVLVDTKLEADTPEARAARADLAGQVERLGQEVVAAAMVPRLLAPPGPAPTPRQAEIAASLRTMIHGQPVATIQAALAALAARPDMTDAMRRLRSPALLVVGEHDAITPPDCLRRAEGIMPVARLVIVPSAGHLVPLESPDVFNAAVAAFLRELPARPG
jgi:pimeloyl-ACP methyl ester carboxylesterase